MFEKNKTKQNRQAKDMTKICEICKSIFSPRIGPSRVNRGRFCSRSCFFKSRVINPITFTCQLCGHVVLNRLHKKNPKFCSNKCRYDSFKNRVVSIETRKKMSEFLKKKVANGTHQWWKGGIWPENLKERNRIEYKLWRESVFARDNWTCRWCGDRSGEGNRVYLEAHHVKQFALYPNLRFEVSNGLTLCKECHNITKPGRNKKAYA